MAEFRWHRVFWWRPLYNLPRWVETAPCTQAGLRSLLPQTLYQDLAPHSEHLSNLPWTRSPTRRLPGPRRKDAECIVPIPLRAWQQMQKPHLPSIDNSCNVTHLFCMQLFGWYITPFTCSWNAADFPSGFVEVKSAVQSGWGVSILYICCGNWPAVSGFHTRSLSISSFRKCEFLLHNWSQQIRAIKSLCCGFCKIRRYKKSFKNLKKTGAPVARVHWSFVGRLARVPGMPQHRCGRRGNQLWCFFVFVLFLLH